MRELLDERSEHAKHFDNEDGTFTATFGYRLHYHDGKAWQDCDRSFRADGADFVADRLPHVARISDGYIHLTRKDNGRGLRYQLPGVPSVSGNKATFTWNDIEFAYYATKNGLKLEALIDKPLGSRTFQFNYARLGGAGALSVEADGSIQADGWYLPRPVAYGANRKRYECGAWQKQGQNLIKFSWDDRALPAEAYPYRLDPSTDFPMGASGDDAFVYGNDASYPPASGSGVNTDSDTLWTERCDEGAVYAITNTFTRWDTSSLDDAATLTGASVRAYMAVISDPDDRNLTADWYTSWPITTDDYQATALTDALASLDLGTLTLFAYNTITLDNATGVSKTGYTGLRWHIDGGVPGADHENHIGVCSFDHATYDGPQLSVTYTLGTAAGPAIFLPDFHAANRGIGAGIGRGIG